LHEVRAPRALDVVVPEGERAVAVGAVAADLDQPVVKGALPEQTDVAVEDLVAHVVVPLNPYLLARVRAVRAHVSPPPSSQREGAQVVMFARCCAGVTTPV
jgi:hypothetical protein